MIEYIRSCSNARITIGEGCGEPSYETPQIFDIHGYTDLAQELGVGLLDLNTAPLVKREIPDCLVFPEMYLPEVLFETYILSVPVLKAHSLASISGSLKNMIGAPPPKHYEGRHGSWKKAVFHGRMQESIIDLVRYRAPDMTLMDATVGLAEYHLGGPHCDPPVNRILAGLDPWEVDREAANLLGLDWQTIAHLHDARVAS